MRSPALADGPLRAELRRRGTADPARRARCFGDLVVPSSVSVGWWFGTPRYRPFFHADVLVLAPER
jgi:hypothetical protein